MPSLITWREPSMPVRVAKRGNKWIVVEAATGRKSKHSGTFDSRAAAQKQANAINANS